MFKIDLSTEDISVVQRALREQLRIAITTEDIATVHETARVSRRVKSAWLHATDQITETEWAWAAGIVEGEGCIAFQGINGVYVVVQMTDKDVIERLHLLYPSPGGIKLVRARGDSRKDQWRWGLYSRNEVCEFLQGILPWLSERRGARAAEALHRLALNRGKASARVHCPNGHAYTPDNTYLYGTHRVCRTCANTKYGGPTED